MEVNIFTIRQQRNVLTFELTIWYDLVLIGQLCPSRFQRSPSLEVCYRVELRPEKKNKKHYQICSTKANTHSKNNLNSAEIHITYTKKIPDFLV